MSKNPYRSPVSFSASKSEYSNFSNGPIGGSHLGLRILRTIVYAVLPVPILAATSLLITDLFYFNHHDPEFLRLSELHEAGYLHMFFIYYCVFALFYVALPLLGFSIVIEFVCKKMITRVLTGVGFGFLVSIVLLYYTPLLHVTFVSRWESIESCVNFLNPVVVLVCIALFAGLFSRNDRYRY